MKKQLHILDVSDAFESLDELWLYNLNKYFETHDANWFIDGYTGKEKKLDALILEPIANRITESYYERTGDRSMEDRLVIMAKIDKLATKFAVCSAIVHRMWKGFDNSEESLTYRHKFIMELEKWGYKMNALGSLSDDANRLREIHQTLQGIETEIAILHEKLKKKRKGDAISMDKMLIIAEKALGLQRKINPKDTTVSEWIGMMERLEELAQKN